MQAINLTDLKHGKDAQILEISKTLPGVQEKLIAMGILPGKTISLLHSFPSYVFQIGHSRFAVDHEIASAISIKMLEI
ncbi:MAG: hypothetical protein A3B70_01420 [Deltaproteobacteria bacterium RIFCSPHIGHO2_02_FULL_40_11]|nr:MAG: hypothetical protein A3B70_01420 [Deltaproteobacteria bacterium RIFCSPHIGHO2_02_FULL_40_11]